MGKGAAISTDLSYLYERLLFKLSDDGFQDVWSIGSFLVIFIFCTITITLTLTVIISWCCGWCLEKSPQNVSRASIGPLNPSMSRVMSSQMQRITRNAHTQHSGMLSTPGPVSLTERPLTKLKAKPAKKRKKDRKDMPRSVSVKHRRRSRPPTRMKPKEAPV